MMSAKIATAALGLLLLLPIAASFWMMAFRLHPSPDEVLKMADEALTKLKAEVGADAGFPGAIAVQSTQQIQLPFISWRIWSPYPRRWVGVLGLGCTAIIAVLWAFSSFCPGLRVNAGFTGWEVTGPPMHETTSDPRSGESITTWENAGSENE
jgi:hypothetical protein